VKGGRRKKIEVMKEKFEECRDFCLESLHIFYSYTHYPQLPSFFLKKEMNSGQMQSFARKLDEPHYGRAKKTLILRSF